MDKNKTKHKWFKYSSYILGKSELNLNIKQQGYVLLKLLLPYEAGKSQRNK